MGGFDDDEAQSFAAAFRRFLEWVHSTDSGDARRNEVVALVRDYLGDDGIERSVVSRSLPVFEHVNLQTALDAWITGDGRRTEVRGVVTPPHHAPVDLQQIVMGVGMPPLRLAAPPLVDLANGPDSTLACYVLALLLVEDARGRYVVMVVGPSEHDPRLSVAVAGLDVTAAQSVHAEIDALRSRLNVYRGHVLDVAVTPMGGIRLEFAELPATSRDQVILPEPVLRRIERHALDVTRHRAALRAAGQHIKRGLLLYGPPGTGKTHTARYLLTAMTGYTRLTLTGRTLHAIGQVMDLARELQPTVIALEDVDLVAEDRSFGPGGNSVLFDLLDAMDGAAADADLLFVLTTNRADLLEPALAARPGRVDVAVPIDLPDADARRRLFDLYGRGATRQLSEADVGEIVARTEGVTASFVKELIRRAVLESLADGSDGGGASGMRGGESGMTVCTAAHVRAALDDLLDASQQVTRTLLGVGGDDADRPVAPAPGPPHPARAGVRRMGRGWTGYFPLGG